MWRSARPFCPKTHSWEGRSGSKRCFSEIAAAPFDLGPLQSCDLPILGAVALPSRWILATWGVVLLVIAGMIVYARAVRLKADATGKEHGDSRLAEKSEMRRFADKRNFCNNVLYSQNMKLAITPYNRHLRNVTKGTNMHSLILGPSGAGKTLHYAIPDILQSLGGRVKPLPSTGLAGNALAIIEHIAGKEGGQIVTYEPTARYNQGYDLVVTDLKGELTEMFGQIIEQTGGEMCVFDVKDFEGCHYNPFDPRYLPTRLTDCCDPGHVQCDFAVRCGNAVEAGEFPASISPEPSHVAIETAEGTCSVDIRLDMKTVPTSALEVGDDDSDKIVREALSHMDETFAEECERWQKMDDEARKGTKVVNPADVVRSFRYNRTSGEIERLRHAA